MDSLFLVKGRIISIKKFGKINFINIVDWNLLILQKKEIVFENFNKEIIKKLKLGKNIKLEVFINKKKEKLYANRVIFIQDSESYTPFPKKCFYIKDKKKLLELKNINYIINYNTERLYLNSYFFILNDLIKYLMNKDYLNTRTNILNYISDSDKSKTFITNRLNLLGNKKKDLFLRTSLEVKLKNLLCLGFDKVFEIGRCFRNEGITYMHNYEFTMLELYDTNITFENFIVFIKNMIYKLFDNFVVFYKKYLSLDNCEIKSIIFKEIYYEDLLKEFILKNGLDNSLKKTQYLKNFYLNNGYTKSEIYNYNREIDSISNNDDLLDYKLFEDIISKKNENWILIRGFPNFASSLSKEYDKKYNYRSQIYFKNIELIEIYNEENNYKNIINKTKINNNELNEELLRIIKYGFFDCNGLGMGLERLVKVFLEFINPDLCIKIKDMII